jgi:hypothetical protein
VAFEPAGMMNAPFVARGADDDRSLPAVEFAETMT